MCSLPDWQQTVARDVTKITSGNGTIEDLERLRNLAGVIKDTALCGLGQTSPNPVCLRWITSMMNIWPREGKTLSVSSMSRTDAIFINQRNARDVRFVPGCVQ